MHALPIFWSYTSFRLLAGKNFVSLRPGGRIDSGWPQSIHLPDLNDSEFADEQDF